MAEEERPAEILDHVGYVRRLQDEGDPEQEHLYPGWMLIKMWIRHVTRQKLLEIKH